MDTHCTRCGNIILPHTVEPAQIFGIPILPYLTLIGESHANNVLIAHTVSRGQWYRYFTLRMDDGGLLSNDVSFEIVVEGLHSDQTHFRDIDVFNKLTDTGYDRLKDVLGELKDGLRAAIGDITEDPLSLFASVYKDEKDGLYIVKVQYTVDGAITKAGSSVFNKFFSEYRWTDNKGIKVKRGGEPQIVT